MSKRRELEQQTSSFAKKIDHFLHENTNLMIHGVARQGSRKEGSHKDDSDLDIVFAISGDPDREDVYPDLAEKLEKVMNVQTDLGENGNVINIKKGKVDVDLVLLPMEKFENQIQKNKIKRIKSFKS